MSGQLWEVVALQTVLEKKLQLISDQLQFFFLPVLCIDQLQFFYLQVKKVKKLQLINAFLLFTYISFKL